MPKPLSSTFINTHCADLRCCFYMISIASWIDSIIRRVSRSFTSQAFGTLPNFLSLALEQQVVTLFHVLELSRCSTVFAGALGPCFGRSKCPGGELFVGNPQPSSSCKPWPAKLMRRSTCRRKLYCNYTVISEPCSQPAFGVPVASFA